MMMNWEAFFSMDGKGFYVWGSFGAFLLCIIVEIVMVRLRIGAAQQGVRDTVGTGNQVDQAGM